MFARNLFKRIAAASSALGGGAGYALAAGGGAVPSGGGFQPTEREGAAPEYAKNLWKDRFKKYGYDESVPEGDLFVHDACLADTTERNISSREHHRLLAKDPADLPNMSLAEFDRQAANKKLATFRGGVYDISGFCAAHPGGDRILMAQGNDLEAFWDVYRLHYRPHIQHLIEDFRIANLSDSDARKIRERTEFPNTFDDEPERPRSILRFASERPANTGPRLCELTKSFFTPNELHYCRNHCPVPRVDPEEYRFVVHANPEIGLRGAEFTLHELKTLFEPHYVACTLQCAGGRQEDFVIPERPLYVEAKWREEAWGTAMWRGTKVRDILKHCGLDVDAMSLGQKEVVAKYLNAYAMDESETGSRYASFIPFEKAIDPFGDAIIAWEMNGVDVPRDHGYPCRLLSPGNAGFRNVKWVEEIAVTTDEIAEGCDQKNQHFGPEISFRGHFIPGRSGKGPTPDLMDVSAPRVCTVPVYSTITVPQMGETIPGDQDFVEVQGVAWSGGGRGINRVEVSIDGGRNFLPARLVAKPPEVAAREPTPSHGLGRCWTWQQWKIEYPLTEDMMRRIKAGEKLNLEIVSRARDGDFNVQPQSVEDSYNVLGKCVNHWPRRMIYVDPKYKTGDALPDALVMPPPGQWIWRRHYDERVDLDDPRRYNEEFEAESVLVDAPTPKKRFWW